ncbi:unnamed protein product [Rotaria sp. Silwood2]|nr:unnamed protein product [Rotaria sp. Silwood2]
MYQQTMRMHVGIASFSWINVKSIEHDTYNHEQKQEFIINLLKRPNREITSVYVFILANINGMDFSLVNLFIILLIILIDYSSFINAYDFQCLTCDNFIDGPGCGEFTREIPVKTCRTYCYFAVIYNRSLSLSIHQREISSNTLTRAIRDCSPYEDMSIEENLLLESKIGRLSSSIDIITLKRCNSEQCNNEFYIKPDEFLFGRCSSYRQISFPVLIFSFVIIFY